jgi:outer membrane receptor for ferrienterochelin and colicins
MLQVGRNFFDGWNPPGTQAQRSYLWNPREQYNAHLRFGHTIAGFRSHLQAIGFSEEVYERSEPLITPYTAYATDQVYKTLRASVQAGTEKQFSPRSRMRYRYVRNTYRKDLVALEEQLTSDFDDDDTTSFSAEFFRGTWTLESSDKRRTVLLGTDMNNEQATGRRINGETRSMTDVGLFASSDLNFFKGLLIRPSVRFIYNSRFNAPVVPGIHLKYEWKPGVVLRASASTGYRAPALKEQYLYFVDNGLHNIRGNPELKAEHSMQLQAGADLRISRNRSVFSIEPTVYQNQVADRIVLVQAEPNSTLYTYMNIDRFTARGIELRGRWSHDRFTATYGVSLTGVEAPVDGRSMPEASWFEHSFSADYKVLRTGTTLSGYLKFNGSQPVFVLNSEEAIDRFNNQSFTLIDLSISQPLWHNRLKLTIGGRNLLDVTTINAISSGGFHTGGSAANNTATVGTGATFFTQLNLTL